MLYVQFVMLSDLAAENTNHHNHLSQHIGLLLWFFQTNITFLQKLSSDRSLVSEGGVSMRGVMCLRECSYYSDHKMMQLISLKRYSA